MEYAQNAGHNVYWFNNEIYLFWPLDGQLPLKYLYKIVLQLTNHYTYVLFTFPTLPYDCKVTFSFIVSF